VLIGVVLLADSPEISSRVQATLAVSRVLPGLSELRYEIVSKSIVARLLNPTYAAVATPKILEDASQEFAQLSKKFERVIFLRGDSDLGIVEHSLLHELGHISYFSLYPEKVEERRQFYSKLKKAIESNSKLSYLMTKAHSITEFNPKARVFLSLESDELYANRFAYNYNTDRLAYRRLMDRELFAAKKAWERFGFGNQFDIAFHMVIVDMHARVLDTPWLAELPAHHRWLLPYTTAVVDALDKEDAPALFARQLLLFNALNRWTETTEEEIKAAVS